MKNIVLFGFVFLVVACSRNPVLVATRVAESATTISDGGLLTRRPCGPPCFYGIIPGTTTTSEAEERMRASGGIFANCQRFDLSSTGGGRGANCDYVNLGFQDGVVSMVSFKPSVPIRMQAVLRDVGPPSIMGVGIISRPDEPDKTRMVLYFDSIFALLQLPDQDGGKYNVSPESPASLIVYLSPDRYAETRNLPGNLSWQGFMSYTGTR